MFKLFKNLTKKEYLLMLVSAIFIIGQVYLELKMPDYMSAITRLVQTEGSKMIDILKNGGYMLLCALGSIISAVFVGYLIAYITSKFSLNTRKKLFTKVLNFGLGEVKEFKTSSLITRTTNDITQIEMFLGMGLQLLIKSPVTAVWAVTKILNKSLTWSAVTALAVLILLSTVSIITMIVVPKFKIVQRLIDKLNNITRENLNGLRVIRAFNAEDYQTNKFEDVNYSLTKQLTFNQKMFSVFMPVMYLIMHTLTLSIYLIGAHLISNSLIADKITIFSNMIVFSSYAMQVIMSFLMLALVFMLMPRANVSAKRINEVLDKDLSILDGTLEKDITNEKGTIEFKNVYFQYDDADEYVLEDISLKVNKGETVAFIGSTGSGKSTLINLIPRFYDVTKGEILVDGVNIKDYKESFLRSKLGYVSQKAVIFSGTVKSNIKYGNNKITDKIIKDAIKYSEAEEFVLKMDHKYDSKLSQGGTNISGGQKQRLSIARAIAKNPEIYIFDDSFSALDYKTDALIRKNLKKYTKDSTVLIVAQRIGTVLNADKIVVLDQGKCVGIGTHKELFKNCEIYKQIALSQLSKEELENA